MTAADKSREQEEEILAAEQQLAEEEAAVEAEIAEATRPATAARIEHAAAVQTLTVELEALRQLPDLPFPLLPGDLPL